MTVLICYPGLMSIDSQNQERKTRNAPLCFSESTKPNFVRSRLHILIMTAPIFESKYLQFHFLFDGIRVQPLYFILFRHLMCEVRQEAYIPGQPASISITISPNHRGSNPHLSHTIFLRSPFTLLEQVVLKRLRKFISAWKSRKATAPGILLSRREYSALKSFAQCSNSDDEAFSESFTSFVFGIEC